MSERDIENRRAISTVVDVALCLLFVSGAVLTLGLYLESVESGDDRSDPELAGHTAETMSATTLTVEYSLWPLYHDYEDDDGHFDGDFDESVMWRTTHGPSTALLADGATTTLSFEDEKLTHGGTFEDDLEEDVIADLADVSGDVHVIALWEPYEGASLVGEAELGKGPVTDTDVHTATITVPSGFSSARVDAAVAAETGDMDDVAAVVADAFVAGYLPPAQTQRSFESGGFERELTAHRYLRLAEQVGLEDDDEFTANLERTGDAAAANDRLREGLTDVIATDLEETYDDPEAAAQAVSVGEVTITIRTW